MDLAELQVFLTVASERSFSKASGVRNVDSVAMKGPGKTKPGSAGSRHVSRAEPISVWFRQLFTTVPPVIKLTKYSHGAG